MQGMKDLSLDQLFEQVRDGDAEQSAVAEAEIRRRTIASAGRHAAIAIIARNMSHNIGAHALATPAT